MKESVFRSNLTYKLRKLGWKVHEEMTLLKNGKKYRADIIAHHPAYKDLGWFVIEAKTADHIHSITSGHKQIVTKYMGSTIKFYNKKPICFVIIAPYIPTHAYNENPWSPSRKDEEFYKSGWYYVVRLFNRYGIGIIDNTENKISFSTDYKYEIYLDPRKKLWKKYDNLPIIKKFLTKRLEELQ